MVLFFLQYRRYQWCNSSGRDMGSIYTNKCCSLPLNAKAKEHWRWQLQLQRVRQRLVESCLEVLCIWNAAPHNCSRRDPSQCCSSKHAGYDCVRHHLLGDVLIEDRQVVVGASVKEWANVCVCCESMRFQSNKPTQSWCMHPKLNQKSKSLIRFKCFIFFSNLGN